MVIALHEVQIHLHRFSQINDHNQKILRNAIYRVIQKELPPLTELNSDDILSKKCHIILGPILNICRVTFVFGFFLNFNFNFN
jgi:hypothetical protein